MFLIARVSKRFNRAVSENLGMFQVFPCGLNVALDLFVNHLGRESEPAGIEVQGADELPRQCFYFTLETEGVCRLSFSSIFLTSKGRKHLVSARLNEIETII